jgi:ketosteroid isomerase-like protein
VEDAVSLPEAVAAEMRATNERFCAEVIGRRDVGALREVYTADARVLPPGADLVEGRQAIQQFWQKAIEGMGIKSATLETVAAEMCGESVVEIGRAVLSLESGGTVNGKYVVHWKQEDGRWKWATDIWNTH